MSQLALTLVQADLLWEDSKANQHQMDRIMRSAVGTKEVIDNFHDLFGSVVGQTIVDHLAIAARRDQTL